MKNLWTKNYRPQEDSSWIYFNGPKNIPSGSSPLEIFKKLWSSSLNQSIISETNSKEKNFNLDQKGLDLYIAAILVMSVVPEPFIEHYWSGDSEGILGNTFIKNLTKFGLSRDLFKRINSHLHIDPNYLIQELNHNFKEFYHPEQNLSVDECLSLFKGSIFKKISIFLWKIKFSLIFF